MSGEESLAQVYREIEQPKVKNLQRAGLVIFAYSLVFTGLVSFFATAIIPDSVRPQFAANLISGLAMHLVGPESLRLLFQAFVVVVGFLILAGAANTAIVGSNGVLNRVCEDGVLTDWFRRPHPRFGTTYRLINLTVILQIVTIVLSRGDVYMLGEAYAFGVVWSFAFKLSTDDVERIHRVWADSVQTIGPTLHHRDIVSEALATLEEGLGGAERERLLARLRERTARTASR